MRELENNVRSPSAVSLSLRSSRAILAAASLGVATQATAELQLSFYGGYQTSPHSDVSVYGDRVVPDLEFTAGWEGRSFTMPPYYGYRATWWYSENFGFGVDVNHTKVYADDATLAETGYEHFEFSDGLNIVTLNAYRFWNNAFAGVSPYVGGGFGVAIPHVELTEGTSRTFEYQLTGPAVAWMAGASMPLSDQWSLFGEYKGTYSINSADLVTGGLLETNVITNALNVGISFNF